jgi:hypothetical protein
MTSSEHDGPLHATGLAFEKLKNRWHLVLTLEDGRVHVVPLTFYPTLQQATQRQRENWEWIGKGDGVHWPDLDLDLSVGGIAQGRREHVPARAGPRAARWKPGQPLPTGFRHVRSDWLVDDKGRRIYVGSRTVRAPSR